MRITVGWPCEGLPGVVWVVLGFDFFHALLESLILAQDER